MKRLSDLQLGQIEAMLTDRDRQVLQTFRQLRYMKTDQVQRLFFPQLLPTTTTHACRIATTKMLNRLKAHGLITHLEKRIGGVRAGSQGLIWHLTEAGTRLLYLGTESDGKRKRTLEPSPSLLRHTLAVTECFVQISEFCRKEPFMQLVRLEVEPDCWRTYIQSGKPISLRPDLYSQTSSGEYVDRMFIEMDLATESIGAIIEKCRRYHEYYLTNKEQESQSVFPLVLWIVPTEDRKQKMIEAIKLRFSNRRAHIFLVITPDQLHAVLRDGAKEEELC